MAKEKRQGYISRKEMCELYNCSDYVLRRDLESCEDYAGSPVEKVYRNNLRYFNPVAVAWINQKLDAPTKENS